MPNYAHHKLGSDLRGKAVLFPTGQRSNGRSDERSNGVARHCNVPIQILDELIEIDDGIAVETGRGEACRTNHPGPFIVITFGAFQIVNCGKVVECWGHTIDRYRMGDLARGVDVQARLFGEHTSKK